MNAERQLLKLINRSYKRSDLRILRHEITCSEQQGLVLLNLLKNRQNLQAEKLGELWNAEKEELSLFKICELDQDFKMNSTYEYMDVLTSTIGRNIDTYSTYLGSDHQQFLKVLGQSLINLLQFTSPTNVLVLKTQTFRHLIMQKQSYPLLAALLNCSSKVLVEPEDNYQVIALQPPRILTGLLIAHAIVKASLDSSYFKCFVKNLHKSQLQKTFNMVCKCKRVRTDCPQAILFLKELTDAEGFHFQVSTLETLINTNNFELIFPLVSKNKDMIKVELRTNITTKKKLWGALARSMKSGLFLEVKLWLILEFSSMMTISFVRSICETHTTFSLSRNPIKTCLLYHEVLQKFERKFSVLKTIIAQKANNVIELCSLFIQEIDSEKQMQEILSETDLIGYPVKNLIKKHPQLLLKIETVIQRDWQGYLDIVTHETFELSALYHATREHNVTDIAMG